MDAFIQALQSPCLNNKDSLKYFGTTNKNLSIKDAYLIFIKQQGNYDLVGFLKKFIQAKLFKRQILSLWKLLKGTLLAKSIIRKMTGLSYINCPLDH